MAIAIPSGTASSTLPSDKGVARLLGFSQTGRSTTKTPSRRVHAIALGLDAERGDRTTRVAGFAQAVNLALATHGPLNAGWGNRALAWQKAKWTLPVAYRIESRNAPSGAWLVEHSGVDGLAYAVAVDRAAAQDFRITATTSVGDGQSAIVSLPAMSATISTTGGNLAPGETRSFPIAVAVAGNADTPSYLWERYSTMMAAWTTTFHLGPSPMGTVTAASFVLRLSYEEGRGASYSIALRCAVRDGPGASATVYDLLPTGSLAITQSVPSGGGGPSGASGASGSSSDPEPYYEPVSLAVGQRVMLAWPDEAGALSFSLSGTAASVAHDGVYATIAGVRVGTSTLTVRGPQGVVDAVALNVHDA